MAKQRQEATLLELLNDPIALILMKRDGVDRSELWCLLMDVKYRLKEKKISECADLAA